MGIQLCEVHSTAQAARADSETVGGRKLTALSHDKHVAVIPPGKHPGYLQPVAKLHREVLCTVYRDVDIAVFQRLFYLLDENALAAYAVQRTVEYPVAPGGKPHEFDVYLRVFLPQRRSEHFSLREG